MKTKHALSDDEMRRELESIQTCWKLLTPLDTNARGRALQWLHAWVHSEAPANHEGLF